MLPGADEGIVAQARYMGATYTHMEPRIFEGLVAVTYLLTGEHLWIARLYSIVFWLVGGAGLLFLANKLSGFEGATATIAYYLLLPFGVSYSRTYLPDLLMLPLIIWGLLAVYTWMETPNWKWALIAGVLSGLAILVKVFAIYYLLIPTALLILLKAFSHGFKSIYRNPQVWAILGLMVVIPSFYYLSGKTSGSGGAIGYLSTWSLPYLHLLLDPNFYIGWFHKLGEFNLTLLLLSFGSMTLLPSQGRTMAAGLWLAYLLVGLTLPSLIRSHAYYSLPLAFIVALSFGSVGKAAFEKILELGAGWRLVIIAAMLAGFADTAIMARKPLVALDYSQEPAFWEDLGKRLPTDGNIIGLSEDYNTRIQYYGWRYVKQYPFKDDFDMSVLAGGNFNPDKDNFGFFLMLTEGMDYFLVTTLEEFDNQPYLERILYNYYPIVLQGERYVLFDLRKPTKPIPEG